MDPSRTHQSNSSEEYSLLSPRVSLMLHHVITTLVQDKEVAVVVSFLEIYCDQIRDLGEAYMSSHRGSEVDDLKITSDIYKRMKLVRRGDVTPLPFLPPSVPRLFSPRRRVQQALVLAL